MKVLFYSVKGGQGKTTHAVGLAKYKNSLYMTNDFESGTIEIYQEMFEENQMQIIYPQDDFNIKDLNCFEDIVFDFGGWVDSRIEIIAEYVDSVVIPITFQSIADLIPCLKTIKSLEQYNNNIVIVINNTDTKEVGGLKARLNEAFPDNAVFVVNRSKYINRLANEGKTIFDLFEQGGITKFNLKKSGLAIQVKELFNYLEGLK